MRTRLINMKDVTWKQDFYPRIKPNWLVSYQYSQAMRAGAIFPPIVVAKHRGKLILVDGKHRMEATKLTKEKYIKATILDGLSEKQIYIEAVKSNVAHGYPLAPKEKREIILRLQDMDMSENLICELVRVPTDKLTTFVGGNLVNDITGQVIVKAPLQHLAGGDFSYDMDKQQRHFAVMSQQQLLIQVIDLIDKDMIDKKDKRTLKLWLMLRAKMRKLKL